MMAWPNLVWKGNLPWKGRQDGRTKWEKGETIVGVGREGAVSTIFINRIGADHGVVHPLLDETIPDPLCSEEEHLDVLFPQRLRRAAPFRISGAATKLLPDGLAHLPACKTRRHNGVTQWARVAVRTEEVLDGQSRGRRGRWAWLLLLLLVATATTKPARILTRTRRGRR